MELAHKKLADDFHDKVRYLTRSTVFHGVPAQVLGADGRLLFALLESAAGRTMTEEIADAVFKKFIGPYVM